MLVTSSLLPKHYCNAFLLFCILHQGSNPNEAEGLQFLQRYDDAASFLCNLFMEASWLYNTNVTEHNKRNMVRDTSLFRSYSSRLSAILWPSAIIVVVGIWNKDAMDSNQQTWWPHVF